jgi:hypothetical protein
LKHILLALKHSTKNDNSSRGAEKKLVEEKSGEGIKNKRKVPYLT